MTVNVMQPPVVRPEKNKVPSIPITPFVQAAVVDVDNDLLWFNTHVNRTCKSLRGKLSTELAELIRVRSEVMERMATSDYNTELVTVFAAEIAAAAFLLYQNYGGEPVLKRG
jgi:hypothetical protein